MTPVQRKFPFKNAIAVLAAAALLLAACVPSEAQAPAPATAVPVTGNDNLPPTPTTGSSIPEAITPAVKVADQSVEGGSVTVEQVTSPGPGWIVIHTNASGAPGPIIGFAPVKAGVNTNVAVQVDPKAATPVLYAMLHEDAGVVGTYEFPGADVPLTFNGQMVSPAFANSGAAAASGATGETTAAPAATTAATAAASAAAEAGATAAATTASGGGYGAQATTAPAEATVSVAENPKLGKILVDSKGMTLYIFKKDAPGQTACTGGCLENWPALLVTSGEPSAGEGVGGELSVLARPEGGSQVMYNNQPLYYFAGDQAPGDVNGQGVGDAWFVVPPAPAPGGEGTAPAATISVAENAKLGRILVDNKGMTLYIFKKDAPGQSACSGGCLENWPALLVASGAPSAGEGAGGQLGVLTRPEGGSQVTYNNLPLYYFAGDQAPGDVNGQGIGNIWFAATP